MRPHWPLAALLFAALLGVAACGGGSEGDDGSRWEEVAEDLRPGLNEGSDNPCQSGQRECLDIVMAEMKRRLEPLDESCDHDALFATMYLRMTEQVRDAYDAGDLQTPAVTSHLTAWFANYYFRAYDDWHAGREDAVPRAWQVAFDAADDRRVRGLGNLLLGMNAHVSRDLPYVVSEVLPGRAAVVDPDYDLVNTLIATLSADLLFEVGDRFDPTVLSVALPLSLGPSGTFGTFVTLWRGDSWDRGNELLGATGEQRVAIERRIELDANSRALALLPEVGYLPFVESSASRDAYCEEHR